ncbi:MAG: 4-hydroxyphenylpyruvate dioxygenase [Deltaproteobacteria bacterium]|nr:4-hydroxyphenylpyruvate dioxygenase [Deltaproteobacteria bacterium]
MSRGNDLGLDGIEFIEFASPEPRRLHQLFQELGFSRTRRHEKRDVSLYEQNQIRFLLNDEAGTSGRDFATLHGPSITAMGWRVKNAPRALELALSRGARRAPSPDYGSAVPAVFGIGGSLIYLVEAGRGFESFQKLERPDLAVAKGFLALDHLTNNVEQGTLRQWSDFYKNVFGFTEVRYFDIRGASTGLVSHALRSPCGKFCIPINEGTESGSQINEYLREYRGPGIQHLAFLTDDILASLDALEGSSIETLDIDDEYYREVFQRVPNVTEDHRKIREHQVLVDGDEKGYLLQIFTRNLVGPIFIELIQRKNHLSFGEGNFSALFRSIERDQRRRGVLAG